MPRLKTDAEFKKEVYDLVGNEYTFLDSYVTARTKIRVKHNKCGNVYEVDPSHFLRGKRCPYCNGGIKKTGLQFTKEVFDLVGDEYILLDSYVNSYTKIKVKHNKCGHTYKVTPASFIKGNRCPYCFGNPKKTNEEFKKEVFDLVGNEYTFLEPYRGTHIKIEVKHNKCGNVYKVQPANFLSNNRCPYCAGHIKKTNNQFRKEVYDLVGDEYTFLDLYVNNHTKLKVRHNKCGLVYKVEPNSFVHGTRCPYCNGNAKKTNTQFQHEVHDLVGSKYVFLDTYVNAQNKLRVKHNKCGHIYEVTPHNFLHGYRCPYCSMPKEEKIITKILDDLDINYDIQKTFDDLRDVQLLSYDFYLPNQNILIECQGQQHYGPVDIFGGDSQFMKQQKHDQMKSDYAKDHDYNLIAVPYTEDTFSKIKKYLIKHGLSN